MEMGCDEGLLSFKDMAAATRRMNILKAQAEHALSRAR